MISKELNTILKDLGNIKRETATFGTPTSCLVMTRKKKTLRKQTRKQTNLDLKVWSVRHMYVAQNVSKIQPSKLRRNGGEIHKDWINLVGSLMIFIDALVQYVRNLSSTFFLFLFRYQVSPACFLELVRNMGYFCYRILSSLPTLDSNLGQRLFS